MRTGLALVVSWCVAASTASAGPQSWPRPADSRPRGRHLIASASTGDGPPATWVYCDGVARFLGVSTPFRPQRASVEDWMRFTRALGRVVAHEVVHLLAPSISHEGSGLMGACPQLQAFLRLDIEVDPRLAERVQAAVREGWPLAAGEDAAERAIALVAAP